MNIPQIIIEYLDCFVKGQYKEMKNIFTDDLVFKGPLLECNSASEYIEALQKDIVVQQNDPPHLTYKIINSEEKQDSLLVIYDYIKKTRTVRCTQRFNFRDGKISKMVLEFNKSTF